MPININDPIPGGMQGIDSLLASYQSPEAAQSDLTRNRDIGGYLEKQYQGLTGDYFANPFQDAIKKRDIALATTIQQGRGIGPSGVPVGTVSTATGSNVGPSILGFSPNSPLHQGPGIASLPPLSSITSTTPEHPLGINSNTQTPDYFHITMEKNPLSQDLSNQQKRVNAVGGIAGNLFQRLKKSTPDALVPKDIKEQDLQLDEKGVPVAGNVLNIKLYSDPAFRYLMKTQPEVAHKFYLATQGRNLEQDIKMQAAHESIASKSKRDVLEMFAKNGDFDPVTQQPFMRNMVNDPLNPGTQIEVKRPLSYNERKVLDEPGVMENLTGQKPPAPMDLSSSGATTSQEKEAIRNRVIELHSKSPNTPLNILMLQARKDLAGVQTPPTTTSSDPRAWYEKMGDIAGQTAVSAINSKALRLPSFMRGNVNIPTPTTEQLIQRSRENTGTDLGGVMSEGLDYWNQKLKPLVDKY